MTFYAVSIIQKYTFDLPLPSKINLSQLHQLKYGTSIKMIEQEDYEQKFKDSSHVKLMCFSLELHSMSPFIAV